VRWILGKDPKLVFLCKSFYDWSQNRKQVF
jgi:hypothetical protein